MATLATLRDRVRRMIGGPDTTEMPDATIESALTTDSLDWLNQRDPKEAITYFTTVANQQYYSSKPASAYHVVDVWWDACNYINLGANARFYPEGYEMSMQLAGFDVQDNPALVEIFYKQIEAYKESFGGEGFEQADGTIGLFPCPGSTGDRVYFRYDYPRYSAVTAVPDSSKHQTALVKKAAAVVLEILFIKRGRIRGGRSFSGGGGANEKVMAEKFETEAEAAVPVPLAVFGRG